MTVAPIIAYCPYGGLFSVLADQPGPAPFTGEWRAAALCAGVLAVEFGVLLWQRRRWSSARGMWLLVLVAATGLGTACLALVAHWYATQPIPPCGGPPVPPGVPTNVSAVQRLEAWGQALMAVEELAELACVVTLILAVMGAVRLLRAR